MPRAGQILFSDIADKLEVMRVECPRHGRAGRYAVARLIRERGRDAGLHGTHRGDRARAQRRSPAYSRRVKAKLLAGAAAGLALALGMPTAQAAPLTIVVDNVCSAQGEIDLTVYDAADWLSNSAGVDRKLPARAGTVTFHFDLPPGTYAAAGFHDANGNGQFDKNFLGWPLEGFGFSNDAHVSFFKPPSFAAASFTLPPTGATETVWLDYWSKC